MNVYNLYYLEKKMRKTYFKLLFLYFEKYCVKSYQLFTYGVYFMLYQCFCGWVR